jgi:transcriptional regulator with XRE-family HTH domain
MNSTALMRARRIAFGEVVRARRLALRLTQHELAEQIDVTRYIINKVEAGGYNLGWDQLGYLADALKTKLSDLFQATSAKVEPIAGV